MIVLGVKHLSLSLIQFDDPYTSSHLYTDRRMTDEDFRDYSDNIGVRYECGHVSLVPFVISCALQHPCDVRRWRSHGPSTLAPSIRCTILGGLTSTVSERTPHITNNKIRLSMS